MTPRRALIAALAVLPLTAGGCHAEAPSTLPVPVTLACNEMAQMLENMPFRGVSRADGPVTDPRTAAERPGCHVRATGSRSRLSVLERTDATSPDARIRELMPPRGWTEDATYAADGPDGTAFSYRAGGTVCHISARWGAEADDSYEIDIACTTAT